MSERRKPGFPALDERLDIAEVEHNPASEVDGPELVTFYEAFDLSDGLPKYCGCLLFIPKIGDG